MAKDKKNGKNGITDEQAAARTDSDADAAARRDAALSLVKEKQEDPEYQAKLATAKDEYKDITAHTPELTARKQELARKIAEAKRTIARSVTEADKVETTLSVSEVTQYTEKAKNKNASLTAECDQLEAEFDALQPMLEKAKAKVPATRTISETSPRVVSQAGVINQARSALKKALTSDGFEVSDQMALKDNVEIMLGATSWTLSKDGDEVMTNPYGRGSIDAIRKAV